MKHLAFPAAAVAIVVLAALLPFASFAEGGGESATFIEGYVSSDIKGENTFLKNAEITAVSSNGTIYRATTDSKGFFSLPCPEGEYSISVECKGFKQVDFGNVSAGGPPLYVTLDMRSSEAIWGMDTPHALQVLGIVILLIIVGVGMAVFLICKRKRANAATVIGPLPEEKGSTEDSDDIGYGEEDGDEYVKNGINYP
jgi:hypothetical protein